MTGLRVVQWATGNIGTRSLQHVIEHPQLTLAGLYVTSPAKVGVDAGELCGLPRTGVTATSDVDEILALDADCVLYMPAVCDLDQVCAILARGTNIVTTRGEFHHPGSMPPGDRERVEQACAAGGTSIHSTGSSPGFISEAVPLVLTSIQRRLDFLAINEYADMSARNSPDMLFNLMGYGHPPEEFPVQRFSYMAHAFGPSLRLVAEAVGMPLDSVTSTGEVAVTPEKLTIAAGTLDAGTVAAADDGDRHARGPPADDLQLLLVRLAGPRPGLGAARGRLERLERAGGGRRPAGHRHPLRHPGGADGRDDPGLHGQPGRQRGAVRL